MSMTPPVLQSFRLPLYRELPKIGLYLDQTVKYINGFLEPLGVTQLTPSMVSNYVKQGMVAPPVKKQYNAEQIAYLFFVTFAKMVLPMERVKQILSMQKESYPADIAYDYFCKELTNMLYFTFGQTDSVEEIDVLTARNPEKKTILRSVIIAISQLVYIESCMNALAFHPES